MPIITIKISEELKRRMREMRHINWSEVVRNAIKRRIEMESGRNIAKALLLNEKNIVKPDKGFSSTEFIRRWRERVRWLEE